MRPLHVDNRHVDTVEQRVAGVSGRLGGGPEIAVHEERRLSGMHSRHAVNAMDVTDTVETMGFFQDRHETGMRLDTCHVRGTHDAGGHGGHDPNAGAKLQHPVAWREKVEETLAFLGFIPTGFHQAAELGRDDLRHERHANAVRFDRLRVREAQTRRGSARRHRRAPPLAWLPNRSGARGTFGQGPRRPPQTPSPHTPRG